MDRAQESGDVAWVLLLAARTPEVLLLLAACVVRRPARPSSPAALGAIAAVGFFDLLAKAAQRAKVAASGCEIVHR